MKKRSKSIILIMMGIIMGASITVTAALVTGADNITFTPTNTSWNVTNTNEALNDLYTKVEYGTATANDILKGKTALVGGEKVLGTMDSVASSAVLLSKRDYTSGVGVKTVVDVSDYKYIIFNIYALSSGYNFGISIKYDDITKMTVNSPPIVYSQTEIVEIGSLQDKKVTITTLGTSSSAWGLAGYVIYGFN